MTKEQCKEKVLEMKNDMDKDFEKGLEIMLSVGGIEMDNAEDNYSFPRSMFAALLLHYANQYDSILNNTKNITIKTLSKDCALLHQRY